MLWFLVSLPGLLQVPLFDSNLFLVRSRFGEWGLLPECVQRAPALFSLFDNFARIFQLLHLLYLCQPLSPALSEFDSADNLRGPGYSVRKGYGFCGIYFSSQSRNLRNVILLLSLKSLNLLRNEVRLLFLVPISVKSRLFLIGFPLLFGQFLPLLAY